MKVKTKSRTSIILGFFVALFLAAEPLMMLWQAVLPPGSFAAVATVLAIVRTGLNYYMTTSVMQLKAEEEKVEELSELESPNCIGEAKENER